MHGNSARQIRLLPHPSKDQSNSVLDSICSRDNSLKQTQSLNSCRTETETCCLFFPSRLSKKEQNETRNGEKRARGNNPGAQAKCVRLLLHQLVKPVGRIGGEGWSLFRRPRGRRVCVTRFNALWSDGAGLSKPKLVHRWEGTQPVSPGKTNRMLRQSRQDEYVVQCSVLKLRLGKRSTMGERVGRRALRVLGAG